MFGILCLTKREEKQNMSKKKVGIIAGITGGVVLLIVAIVVIGINIIGGKIISEKEAKDIAFNHAQVNEVDAEGVFAHLENDDLSRKYKITFHADGIKYEYEINARTGNVEDFDVEGMKSASAHVKNATPNTESVPAEESTTTQESAPNAETPNTGSNNQQPANTQNAVNITEAEAKSIVLARVEGATESNIWIKLDREDGRMVYEGEIVYNGMEYEFEIDANDGNFYSWETESIYN